MLTLTVFLRYALRCPRPPDPPTPPCATGAAGPVLLPPCRAQPSIPDPERSGWSEGEAEWGPPGPPSTSYPPPRRPRATASSNQGQPQATYNQEQPQGTYNQWQRQATYNQGQPQATYSSTSYRYPDAPAAPSAPSPPGYDYDSEFSYLSEVGGRGKRGRGGTEVSVSYQLISSSSSIL